MDNWPSVYVVTEMITILALLIVAVDATGMFWLAKDGEEYAPARPILWLVLLVVVKSLAKDAFWTIVIAGGRIGPLVLSADTLAVILAVIQLSFVTAFVSIWIRIR